MPATKTGTEGKFYGDAAASIMACTVERDDSTGNSKKWVNEEE